MSATHALTPDDLESIQRALAEGAPWSRIALRHGRTVTDLRELYLAHQSMTEAAQPTTSEALDGLVTVTGVTAGHEDVTVDELWERALDQERRSRERAALQRTQTITFDSGAWCVVFASDWHLGGAGVEYSRIRSEVEAINRMPRTVAVHLGDLVDNFIFAWATKIRLGQPATMNIADEWRLAEWLLGMLGPKLVATIGGNHDDWTRKLAGIDALQGMVKGINPGCLYDRYGTDIGLVFPDREEIRVRLRHKWKGHSQWNPTHAIEKAHYFDGGFDVGVGAHTHIAALAREFAHGGERGIAILCGSPKVRDDFVSEVGFHSGHSSTCGALIVPPSGEPFAVTDLEVAEQIMRGYHPGHAN